MLNPRESLVEDVEVQNLRMRLALLKVMVCVPNGQSCEESKLQYREHVSIFWGPRIGKSKCKKGQQFQQLGSEPTAGRLMSAMPGDRSAAPRASK